MVNFEPQRGDEIRKDRPAIVINLPFDQVFDVRLVVPVTGWQPAFEGRITKVKLLPSRTNGLQKDSAADVIQIRTASLLRFRRKVGIVEARTLDVIARSLAIYVGANL
jgi:mRNA interferase MazF